MPDQEKGAERLAWAGAVAGGLVFVVCMWMLHSGRSLSLMPPALAGLLLLVLSLLTAGRLYFSRRQEEEADNLRIYREQHPGTELFEDSDEALKLASRANRIYAVYVLPVAVLVAGAALIAVSALVWRGWGAMPVMPTPRNPLSYASLALALLVAALLAGSYYVGASRAAACRWLRPAGACMFLIAALLLLSSVVLYGVNAGIIPVVGDLRVAQAGLVILMILGIELVLSVIVEFYRPRGRREERPVFESRILALFTEPGGVARNVAASLDYQFGFKISEAGFYRFLERLVVPFAVVLVVCFWLLTCFVVVNVEENGIRERFGAAVNKTPLKPGLYCKLPWPFARIYRFPVRRVQELPIGYIPAEGDDGHQAVSVDQPPTGPMGDMSGMVITWDKQHNKDEVNFVVASRVEQSRPESEVQEGGAKVPVSAYFMAASIPLYFKVENLYKYAYEHKNPLQEIEALAQREVVRYLATVDLFDILGQGRAAGAKILEERIQAACDEADLGITVVFVGLEGIHPPVRTGRFFNEVVSAREEKHTAILEAEKNAIGKEADAKAQAYEIVARAQAYRYDRQQVSEAEAARFNKQLLAYQASPAIFMLRSYLDMLEEQTAGIRKYIVATEKGEETIILNLEEKLRPDLLDIDLDREE